MQTQWTDKDFNDMLWHDCKIHGIAFDDKNFKLILDLDYIINWISSKDSPVYTFEIVPAILSFRNVYDIHFNMEALDIQIFEMTRQEVGPPKNAAAINEMLEYEWCLDTTAGLITFRSVGFQLKARGPRITSHKQMLTFHERGGSLIASHDIDA